MLGLHGPDVVVSLLLVVDGCLTTLDAPHLLNGTPDDGLRVNIGTDVTNFILVTSAKKSIGHAFQLVQLPDIDRLLRLVLWEEGLSLWT